MGTRKIEIVESFCDFCGKELDNDKAAPLVLELTGYRGNFDLCPGCTELFEEKFFGVNPQDEPDDAPVGESEEEYEEEEEYEDEPIGEAEDDYDLDDEYDEEEEEEEPAPPPPPRRKKVRKKITRQAGKKKTTRAAGKKKVTRSRYANPLADIDHKEQDGTVVRADGGVSEGKVLQKIQRAAVSERRGVIRRCLDGDCQHDEDTGRCDECGLKKGETGVVDGSAPAHDPIKANAEGKKEMGIDPYTGACTFPVDVNSERVQRRMRKNLRLQNEALRKKFGKSGRYFNLDPTDGVGRGR